MMTSLEILMGTYGEGDIKMVATTIMTITPLLDPLLLLLLLALVVVIVYHPTIEEEVVIYFMMKWITGL
jgi:hypothetical protein